MPKRKAEGPEKRGGVLKVRRSDFWGPTTQSIGRFSTTEQLLLFFGLEVKSSGLESALKITRK